MTPTETMDHGDERCADCGARLQGGWVQRTRDVPEAPAAPLRAVGRFIGPGPDLSPLSEAMGGFGGSRPRCGGQTAAWCSPAGRGDCHPQRETGRIPIRTIQWWLGTVYQLHLSVGGITAALHGVTPQGGVGRMAAVREGARASPVVHAAETGWPLDYDYGPNNSCQGYPQGYLLPL